MSSGVTTRRVPPSGIVGRSLAPRPGGFRLHGTLGQLYGGQATDPNSAPLIALMGVVLLPRPAARQHRVHRPQP
jgi:hypothetical protein